MDPVTGGLISAGIKGLFGSHSANKAYARQKEMMKHAHQWEVEDLRKAGLNPILSATGGSGAGSFSAPTAVTPDFDLSSAAAAKTELKIAQQNADTNKQNADTQARVGATTAKSNLANADFAAANAAYVYAQKVKAEIESKNLSEWLPKIYAAQIEKELAIAQGTLLTSSASAYRDYEMGAKANSEKALADFTLRSSLKYGKEGLGGLTSFILDEFGADNAGATANGSFLSDLEEKFINWTHEIQNKYGPKG